MSDLAVYVLLAGTVLGGVIAAGSHLYISIVEDFDRRAAEFHNEFLKHATRYEDPQVPAARSK